MENTKILKAAVNTMEKDTIGTESGVEETGSMEKAPTIRRVIGGKAYTVEIRFNPKARETAKQKMERILRSEAEAGKFSA